ncbi:frizzled-2 [Galendromus occidentalis]|uniref:Frizzled-2 n=1 Tax=Galendromus occidentalis TaxID=34638 RepID=A0AAJ6QPL0_9ACAR|nr:frizzled-2 [Galendromus occidentalis]
MKPPPKMILVTVYLLSQVYLVRSATTEDHGRCEAITIPLCKDINYNRTIFPNLLNHQKQEDAAMDAHPFSHLIKAKCSPDLQFFICTVYAPICTQLPYAIPPCRSLCERARTSCEPLMKRFGFTWPPILNCEQFPMSQKEKVCVGNDTESQDHATLAPPVLGGTQLKPSGRQGNTTKNHGFLCPKEFSVPQNLEYVFRIGGKEVKHCGMPCYNMFFKGKNLAFARYLIGGFAILSATSTLFTVCTFLIDTDRFKYPERPIIFLSFCNFIVALVYIIGFLMDKSVACNQPFSAPNGERNIHMEPIIAQNNKNEVCTMMFMVLYFFSMSGAIWWLVLTLAWFLASGLKWGQEAIESNSYYFHLIAWTLPAIKTIIVLAMGKMEGDLLSGVCYVGVWNMEALRHYVLIPTAAYVVVGIIFLFAGFASLCQIRTVMKHGGNKTDKLERLMGRIGLFSVLYLLPTVTLLICQFYEQANLDQWLLSWQWDVHRENRWSMTCPEAPCTPRERYNAKYNQKPIFAVFMIKYLSILVVGISSGVWIWSRKTIDVWRLFLSKLGFIATTEFSACETEFSDELREKEMPPSGHRPFENVET